MPLTLVRIITALVVAPDRQSEGLGTALLAAADAVAK
jgi:hypothetical protein